MTRPEQTAREARHVAAMVEAQRLRLANAPVGHVPPLPDFELTLEDGRRVGLDVTEGTDPEVAAAWGGARARLEKAIVRALERDGIKLECAAYLFVESLLELERDKRLSNEMAATVAAIARDKASTGLSPTNGDKLGLHAVRFLELRPATRTACSIVSSVLPLGPSLVQRAIDLKMPKLDGYRALKADEYWLLVVGGRVLSGYVTVADAQAGAFESPFDRTVFLDPPDGGCVVMDTIPPSIALDAAGDIAED